MYIGRYKQYQHTIMHMYASNNRDGGLFTHGLGAIFKYLASSHSLRRSVREGASFKTCPTNKMLIPSTQCILLLFLTLL